MGKMTEKQIKRRIALCKALFLAPKEIFVKVDGYIDLCLNCYIRDKTGYEPNNKFPLDFWPDKDPLTPPPFPPKGEGINKDATGRAELCKLIFLTPPEMFRNIYSFVSNIFVGYYKEKTGHPPLNYDPFAFFNRGPEAAAIVGIAGEWGKQ